MLNIDNNTHTITAVQGPFDSGVIQPGHSFEYTFNNAGSYVYHDNMNGLVIGRVIVDPAPYTASTIATTTTAAHFSLAWPLSTGVLENLVVGQIIVFVVSDNRVHTVDIYDNSGLVSSSGDLSPGASYPVSFNTPGTFEINDAYDQFSYAVVIVAPARRRSIEETLLLH